ncbi:MAG TPA: glycosyltransferase, partial [Ramlibacter sp.]
MAGRVGIVVIGRNEGARLRACLASLPFEACEVVYVDSGSTDGSLQFAAAAGARGVALDGSRPFTAGRARTAGVAALVAAVPDAEFVQFV